MPGLLVLLAAAAADAATVLVEAEAFADHGGWVVDQQFMDQMGSPYLLAHGLGVPVKDATTTVSFPEAGTYRVFVRTFDWVAPWKAPGHPGRFQVLIDGKPLPTVFGTKGANWFWHDGGTVAITRKKAKLALHDLTGFEGRCDAIVFTTDRGFRPPNELKAMTAFRRKALGLPGRPREAGEFDLVVVGGGVAGTCAAVTAARLGLRVALVQDRPVLGGNSSSEVRVWIGGGTNLPPYPVIGEIVREFRTRPRVCPGGAEEYGDQRALDIVQAEETLSLFLDHHAFAAETEGNRIVAVVARHTLASEEVRFAGRLFADCTGDGTIGYLAGADHEMLDKGHMGRSNLWRVVDTGKPQPFPRCPWALDLRGKPFPRQLNRLGKWFWESGFSHDPIAKGEYIRDHNFRAMYGAWDCLHNHLKLYPTHKLEWAAYITGKRESRRLLGDVVLTKEDIVQGKRFPDGCVPATWSIDLHVPHPGYAKAFRGDEFISVARYTRFKGPYPVPYRCFYSRNVQNLFMAGRDVSVTHEALGSVRVMATGGMMGEVVGRAASLCVKHDCTPRGVYERYLDDFKALCRKALSRPRAMPVPAFLKQAGPSLARAAKVAVSGSRDAAAYPPRHIADGQIDTGRNDLRWLSEAKVPNWVEFSWKEPQKVGIARVVSGYLSGGRVGDPIEDFVFQWHDGAGWKAIAGTEVTANRRVDWHARFEPVTTRRLRLLVRRAPIDIARIWEVELYAPVAPKP